MTACGPICQKAKGQLQKINPSQKSKQTIVAGFVRSTRNAVTGLLSSSACNYAQLSGNIGKTMLRPEAVGLSVLSPITALNMAVGVIDAVFERARHKSCSGKKELLLRHGPGAAVVLTGAFFLGIETIPAYGVYKGAAQLWKLAHAYAKKTEGSSEEPSSGIFSIFSKTK
jgi:hypothetical protein